ncbi:hypothetical protein [Pseudomonas sp. LB3P14]
MTVNTLAASNKQSGTGTWAASILGFRDENFPCTPEEFLSNGKEVYLRVSGPTGVTSKIEFLMRFSASIEQKTYFFGQTGSPNPPKISIIQGGNLTGYISKANEGHIAVETFSIDKGTLKANGNFSFTDHENDTKHQVVFNIDLANMALVP